MPRLLTSLWILILAGAAAADEGPVLACPALVDWTDTSEVLGPVEERGRTVVDAGQITAVRDGVSELSGSVLIEQAGRRIEAERLSWDEPAAEVRAEEGITLIQDSMRIRADRADYDLDAGTGSFEGTEFVVPSRALRGVADSMNLQANGDSRLEGVLITSCAEGHEAWALISSDLELDHEAGVGRGHNVRVELGGVPIFYSPYLTFPLDGRRRSGLLAPSFGSSSRRGTEFSQPVYWNIAPNMDATFTPHNMTARGTALEGEFRYLGRRDRGRIEFAYLRNDAQLGIDRAAYLWNHHLRAGDWRLDVAARHVSDRDYLVDLSDSLDGVTPAHLRRNATLSRHWDDWRFTGVIESWQTLDATIATDDLPYRRVPELTLVGSHPLHGDDFALLLSADAAWFDRSTGPIGARLDLTPGLRWRYQRPGVSVTSILDLRYTAYQLTADANPVDRSPSRAVPRFSLDGRLIYERDAGDGVHQTLEPRIMFLHVPYVDQTDHPIFDTAAYTLDPYTIFRRDRFVGRDLVGDTDQVTIALSHRSFDDRSGRERYAVTLGQVFYLSDRQVTETGIPETEASSSMVAEFTTQPTTDWRFSVSAEWDDRRGELARAAVGLRYNHEGRIVNLRHRVLGATTEQSDASFSWPLTRRINAVGRLNYDHERNRTLERFAGLEYRDCCWAVRVVARSYLVPGTNQTDDSIFLQLVLDGLASLGGGTDELLSRGILGYSTGD